jgi:ABC-type sugar transport system ATPase subunit
VKTVIHGVELQAMRGEFLDLSGLSAWGKRTLQQMVTGLEAISCVTQDHTEAITRTGRIGMLQGGRKMQYVTPDAICNWPAALFVAGFTGATPMNMHLFDATSGAALA